MLRCAAEVTDVCSVVMTGLVLIVVGIKKEKDKNSQKGKKRREKKRFLEIYHVVL